MALAGELYLAAGRVERALELFALFNHYSDKYDDGHVREYLRRYSALPDSGAYQAAIARGRHWILKPRSKPSARNCATSLNGAASMVGQDQFSARELQILQLVADGCSNREIARQLAYSLGTVKWYTGKIYSKLEVNSRTQAVAAARELGLLPQ